MCQRTTRRRMIMRQNDDDYSLVFCLFAYALVFSLYSMKEEKQA